MAPRRKSTKNPKENAAARPPKSKAAARRPSRARAAPPPPTLQQELLQMARGAARTVQQAFLAGVVLAVIAAAALGVWWLRPTPIYSAEELTVGSPFDVTFRAENRNPRFGMARLKISCVVESVRASGFPTTSVDATDMRLPADGDQGLAPGQSATFKCPFRSLIGHPINEDPAVAQRAELYLRSTYDVELLRSWRLVDYSAHFVLDTHFLPPRWVAKP